MSILTFLTVVHTLLSILAIVVGVPAMMSLFGDGALVRFRGLFLGLAGVTSITGFFFPFHGVTPAIVTGVIALAVLAVILVADRIYGLRGGWRSIYAAGMVVSLYLLVFVAVVQAFLKLAFLNRLAPTQTELPFAVAQASTLVLFILLGIFAAIRFQPKAVARGGLN